MEQNNISLPVLVTFMETTVPFGVTFNRFGVAQKGLRYSFSFQKLTVTFNACSVNGLWIGGLTINANTWGCSFPVAKQSQGFPSFEECVENLWRRSESFIDANCKKAISGSDGDMPEQFARFKVAMDTWLSLPEEEKFNMFEESDFYGQ